MTPKDIWAMTRRLYPGDDAFSKHRGGKMAKWNRGVIYRRAMLDGIMGYLRTIWHPMSELPDFAQKRQVVVKKQDGEATGWAYFDDFVAPEEAPLTKGGERDG